MSIIQLRRSVCTTSSSSSSLLISAAGSSSGCAGQIARKHRFAASSRVIAAEISQTRNMSKGATSTAAAAGPATQPVVLCGPSGVGKSTLIKKLFADLPDSFGFSVSHTTRAPRPGEEDKVNYHFTSRQGFEDLIAKGAFLEYAQFGGNYYGTSAKAVEEVSQPDAQGKRRRALLDIDTQGVKLIKANHAYLNPLFLFIAPPSMADLRKRLEGRGTETEGTIQKRLAMAASEMAYARQGNHDVIVRNDDVERAYKVFRAAIDGSLQGKGDELPTEEEEERKLREQDAVNGEA